MSSSRALYIDSCLFIVPGSHKIPRTAEQRKLSSGQIPENPIDMPGAKRVVLQRKYQGFFINGKQLTEFWVQRARPSFTITISSTAQRITRKSDGQHYTAA